MKNQFALLTLTFLFGSVVFADEVKNDVSLPLTSMQIASSARACYSEKPGPPATCPDVTWKIKSKRPNKDLISIPAEQEIYIDLYAANACPGRRTYSVVAYKPDDFNTRSVRIYFAPRDGSTCEPGGNPGAQKVTVKIDAGMSSGQRQLIFKDINPFAPGNALVVSYRIKKEQWGCQEGIEEGCVYQVKDVNWEFKTN